MDSDETTFQAAELPPLRIHHFLTCTAIIAAFMSFYQTFAGRLDHSELGIDQNYLVIRGILEGVIVTACSYGIYWRWLSYRFFGEVGHWFLLLKACNIILDFFVFFYMTLFVWILRGWFEMDVVVASIPWVMHSYQIVGLVILWFGARRATDTPAWRRFVISIILFKILYLGWYGLYLITNSLWGTVAGERDLVVGIANYGFPAVWIGFCLHALWVDRSMGKKRHWSHWLGIAAWMIGIVLGLFY